MTFASKIKSPYLTRGSYADREVYCAGAIGCNEEYNDNSQDARTGSGAHDLLANTILGAQTDIKLTARRYNAQESTLRIAYFQGLAIWRELQPFFPRFEVEYELSGLTTKGTTDLMAFEYNDAGMPQYLRFLDWKLNEQWRPFQLRAYALAAVDNFGFPESGYIDAIQAWLLPGTYHLSRITEDDLEQFRTTLMRQHERAGKQFSAGKWCEYCPIRIRCDARNDYLRSSATAIALTQEQPLTRELLASLYERRTMLYKALKEYDRAVKLEIESAGPLLLPGGGQLGFHESTGVGFPKPGDVVRALANRPDVDLDKLVTISKASLERAVKAAVPKGQGAPTVRQILAELESKGLTEDVTTRRLRVTHD